MPRMLCNYSDARRHAIARLSLRAIREISNMESRPRLSLLGDHRSRLIMHPISALVLRSVSPYHSK